MLFTTKHNRHIIIPLEQVPSSSPLTPEKRLAMAMFILPLQDLNLETKIKAAKEFFVLTKTKVFKEARVIEALNYIFIEQDYFLSFDHCCEYLGMDSSSVKRSIKTLLEEHDNLEILAVYRHWAREQDN